MRGIFFTLVLINLAYFIYGQFISESESDSKSIELAQVEDDAPDGARRIVLLSERSSEGTAASGKGDEPDEQAELPLSHESDFCPAIGPFKDIAAIDAFKKSWGKQPFQTAVTKVKKGATVKYLLKTRAVITPEEAILMTKRLQSLGYDGYMLSNGARENQVVVGIYKTISEIEQIKELLHQEGIETKIEEEKAESNEFWIKVVSTVAFGSVEKSLRKVLISYEDILLSQSLCE